MIKLSPEQKRKILTTRWFEIPQTVIDNPVQKRLLSDLLDRKYTYYVVVAGRRSFKTERFAKRFAVREAISKNNLIILLGAPTRMQAKEIFWEDVKMLVNPLFIKSISDSELKIKVKGTNSEIHIIGLKEFRRKEGLRADIFIISEFQQCDPRAFTQTLQPMINDSKGIGIFEGRPFGKNHLYTYFNKGLAKEPGWSSYLWTSEEILSVDKIEGAKRDLSELDYNREYLARFDTEGTSPYHSFSDKNYRSYTIDFTKPFIVCCDFNYSEKPMSWVIGQKTYEHIGNKVEPVEYWIKTLSYQFTNTEVMCRILHDYFKSLFRYPKEILFYGDYSGDSPTSNSSVTDWSIITNFFNTVRVVDERGIMFTPKVQKKIKPCRSVRASIGATNSRLRNAKGEIRQYVTDYKENKALVDDWLMTTWEANKYRLSDKDPLRGHACRAVDYYNDYEYPQLEEVVTDIRSAL